MKKKKQKNWEDLTFKDHFIFERVMQNPSICRFFLSRVFERGVAPLAFPPQAEKIFDARYEAKGVRLDVLVHEGSDTIGRKQGEFVTAIDEEVRRIKADKEQKEAYMSLTAYIEDMQDESYDAGYTAGENGRSRAIAQRLLQRGLPLDDIAEDTGLTVDQLRQLQERQKP